MVPLSYKSVSGETEFGGVDGMAPEQMREALTLQQETWGMYATNEGGGLDEEGNDTSSIEWGLDHIGEPRQSFSIRGPVPDLTQTAPWNGEEETA